MDGKWIEWMWKVDVDCGYGKWRGSGSHIGMSALVCGRCLK